jgi:drug/metabolite transporter (DMT)-like permease
MQQNPKNRSESTSGGLRTWIGIGLLFMSAMGFSINTVIIKLAFEDGLDVNTANAVRHMVVVVLLFLFLKIRKRQLKLPPRERYTGLALGTSVFMLGIGYLNAAKYLPLSLAILIIYSAPFFVAVIARFTEREPITFIRSIAFIFAFLGLALALKVDSAAALNWRGVAFALIAAIGIASLITISSVTMRTADPQAVNFHCLVAGAVLFAAFLSFTGGPAASITQAGWVKLGVASMGLALGYITLFTGLEIIGPLKSSMLMNMEPILTIILATLLLDERLSSVQWIGAGLVIVGIFLITGAFRKIHNSNLVI